LKCPRCGHEELIPSAPCPECGFSGPPSAVEELGHIRYLLGEIAGWQELSPNFRDRIRERYLRRQRTLEIELGLRPPPLSREEARQAAQELLRQRQLLHLLLDQWSERGWVKPEAAADLAARTRERIQELQARLAEPETPKVLAIERPTDRVALLKSLGDELGRLRREDVWVDEAAWQAAKADLDRRVEQLELKLGLRRPEKVVAPPAPLPKPEPRPRPPREPLTWERVQRTLLSERTLRVLLFVGVFLVFASAITLVIFNWDRFHPWVQVAILTGFTAFFYSVGWYLRARMGSPAAGIGFVATGSLLVPVDFYAVYLSGGIFPRQAWAEVWWLASAVCLAAYVVTTLVLRAEFFGYLVGVAAGSLLCATLQVAGVPGEWWTPLLSSLALLMMLPEQRLERGPEGSRGRPFGRPFRHLALLTVTTVLLLTTGLRIADQIAPIIKSAAAFRLAVALDWWLACAVYAIAVFRRPRLSPASAACITAPVALYLTLELWFRLADVKAAWHALGWALLTPLYLLSAHALQRRFPDPDEARRAQGRIVAGWAVALILLAFGWGFGDMSAAAAAHGVLVGSVLLAVRLWRRPRLLPFASALAFSAATTWMATLGLDLAPYCLGWALLAILHLVAAVRLRRLEAYTPPLYGAGFCVAALALLPPLLAFDRYLLAYALGNWIALAGWAAWLAHGEQHPGLRRLLRWAGPLRRSAPHWAAALPLPVWFWLVWINTRAADGWLGVGFAALAWACLGLGRRLARRDEAYGPPWYTVSFLCSVIGPAVAGGCQDQPLLAVALLSGAAIYFTYACLFRRRWWLWLDAGGLTLPFGYILLLDHLGLPADPLAASLVLVPSAYILIAVWLEKRRRVAADLLEPLYGVAHIVAVAAFVWGFGNLGSDAGRLWAAGGQLMLGFAYGVTAWYLGQEAWGHVAAWLGVVAGGLIATVYSRGRGSSAAKAALLAAAYVLTERALHALRERYALVGKAWPLYRRPLLIAGWSVSGGAIALALARNLWLLGGGPVREDWAIAALLLIVALYALSARLFRWPLFLWLAAPLLFIPWTLLTHRGWYIWGAPPAPNYALAWAALAWALTPIGLLLDGLAGRRYGRPLRTTAHLLFPFALMWGMGDAAVSSATFGLGVAFYVLAAAVDHAREREGLAGARFIYPAALLAPVWAVYLLAWRRPALPHAHFGLLLLLLSPLLFAAARRLRLLDPADALPAYLSCYGCAIAGTMLVSYEQPLLALALLFDAALALISARLTREPLWIYPAAALPPAALALALAEADFDVHRRGWWLIGLGAFYLAQSWGLRRLSAHRYAAPLMATAYAAIALGLPISSFDKLAAFWAYAAAALIYAASAAWLRQPLMLTPAAILAAAPYAVALDLTPWIARADYGLALWPGVVVALGAAHLLDRRLGAPRGFPWDAPERWLPEAARRLAEWWGLPLYLWGYVGALVGALLSLDHPGQLPLALILASAAYGLAAVRFRLRGWLLAAVGAAQAAALATLWAGAEGLLGLPGPWVERLGDPAWRALSFLPVTLVTALAGLWVERRRDERSPLASLRAAWEGWSRPFYWLLALDMLVVQIASVSRAQPGAWVSLAHALLLAALAVVWMQPLLPYLAAGLGMLAVMQRLAWVGAPGTDVPVALALLALGYGLVGYGLEYARRREDWGLPRRLQVLERPLALAGLAVSAVALLGVFVRSLTIVDWLVRSLFGRPVMGPEDAPVVQMAAAVLALTGLLYLAAALVRRWYWRGYGAVALLLCAWSLEWFLVWDLRQVQWYAVPAGLYLLGVGYLEWRQDRRKLALWIDRAGLLLLLGSSFYQSLAETHGWPYALLMGAEGLFLIWWGSARRQVRFLYTGVVGVVTTVVGQLMRQLFTVTNAWIAFGVPGLVIMILVIFIERRLEAVKRVSQEWRERLEDWE